MTLIFQNLTPGQQASRESVERRLLWGPIDYVVVDHVLLASGTGDDRSTLTNELQPGLVLGRFDAFPTTYANYNPDATDGTQVAVGILAHAVNTKDAGGTAQNQLAVMIVAGAIKAGECDTLDALARSHLYGRIFFDDYNTNTWGWERVVPKATNYTVTAADNNRIFTTRGAAGAVTFTLPAISRSLRYRFFNEAGQNMTIAAAAGDTIVTFNDLGADNVALVTASELIGGAFEVIANDDATKWLLFPFLYPDVGGAAQTLTVTT